MKVVVIESPYAGRGCRAPIRWSDRQANIRYARKCLADVVSRGESPYASHLLLTQVLDDSNPDDRKTGINCGLEMHARADIVAFYIDRGMSPGMIAAHRYARELGKRIEHRSLHSLRPVKIELPVTGPFVPRPAPPRPEPSVPFSG